MENPTYVTGHANPDTDSICSAIVYSEYLKNHHKIKAIPCVISEPNEETQFVLDYFKIKPLQIIESAENKEIFLLDHNETAQSLPDIKKATIKGIIDHHKIGDIETIHPIEFINLPLGSTASVITTKFLNEKIPISKQTAGLLLSALLSDTLLLNSPTTTEKDKEIAKKLSKISGLEIEKYGKEMLKAGCNIIEQIPSKIIFNDFKEITKKEHKSAVAQVNLIDFKRARERKQELILEMQEIKEKHKFKFIFVMLTNIITLHTDLLIVGEEEIIPVIEKKFQKKIKENIIPLPKVVSRKKQIVPKVLEIMEKIN